MESSNVKAMREALEQIDRIVYFKKRHTKEEVEAHRLATTVLTMPPRNCDVGTAEEQSDRFDKFCYSHNKCFQCPVKSIYNSHNRQKQLREIIRCEIIWSQMPYKEVK